MRRRHLLLLLVAAQLASADILHMRDGSRHYGELVSQNSRVVVFNVYLSDGRSYMTREFDAADVARVERSPQVTPGAAQDRPNLAPPAPPPPDFEQVVREAEELMQDDEPAAAARALRKLVREAPADERARLSAEVSQRHGEPLNELMATLTLAAAEQAYLDGAGFELSMPTPYERHAVGRRLHDRLGRLLAEDCGGKLYADWLLIDADTPIPPELVVELRWRTRLLIGLVQGSLRIEISQTRDHKARDALQEMRRQGLRLAARLSAPTTQPTASQPATTRPTSTQPTLAVPTTNAPTAPPMRPQENPTP